MGNPTKIAVVLAGAVARGAFEAGVIRALADADVQILRIVAASAGALNGTLLAAAVRSRSLRAGAETLYELWRDLAGWSHVFHMSWRNTLARVGLSDHGKLLALLRRYVLPFQLEDPAPIDLRIVVAPLNGSPGSIGRAPATTYEAVRDFDTTAFASPEGLEGVFAAATASASFPIVFAPVELDGLGPCVDGGIVNNTPLKWALDGDLGAQIETVVVVATSIVLRTEPATDLHGLGLAGHLAEMLIDERLYRDLGEAVRCNEALGRLDALVQQGVLDPAQYDRVIAALGWRRRRSVEIVQIRPATELRGSPFSGFFDADLRREQLEAGFARGQEVLREMGLLP